MYFTTLENLSNSIVTITVTILGLGIKRDARLDTRVFYQRLLIQICIYCIIFVFYTTAAKFLSPLFNQYNSKWKLTHWMVEFALQGFQDKFVKT